MEVSVRVPQTSQLAVRPQLEIGQCSVSVSPFQHCSQSGFLRIFPSRLARLLRCATALRVTAPPPPPGTAGWWAVGPSQRPLGRFSLQTGLYGPVLSFLSAGL